MRLFVALWPAPEVLDVLEGLARPHPPAVRWTSRSQWHVTLRFLGDVEEAEAAAVVQALAAAGRRPARTASLGPATARLNRRTLVVPVAGVDDLAAAAIEATRSFGRQPEDRAFAGHVTLARGRGTGTVPPELAGEEVAASWTVEDLALVRSRLGKDGSRYDTIATVPLPRPTGPQ